MPERNYYKDMGMRHAGESKGYNSKSGGKDCPIGCEGSQGAKTETPGKNASGGKGANSKEKAAYVGS